MRRDHQRLDADLPLLFGADRSTSRGCRSRLQNRVNRAYSDANFLRTAAAAMFVLLALSIVPFVMMLTYLGFIITFFVVLVLLIRWQIQFGRLKTNDADYQKAKRSRTIAAVLWVVAIPLLVVRDLLAAIVARLFV